MIKIKQGQYVVKDGVKDFADNFRHIPSEDYVLEEMWCPVVYVSLFNVGIRKKSDLSLMFEVHDGTGSIEAYWGQRFQEPLLKPERSFEEVVEQDGISNDDQVYWVELRVIAHFRQNHPEITNVMRVRPPVEEGKRVRFSLPGLKEAMGFT